MYINFSEDDLYRANSADLVSYLQSRGERVKRVGSTYKYIYTDGSGTHDSVTISGGKWYDHKNRQGGHAIKFLQEFLNFSFQESVIELLGGHYNTQTVRQTPREAPKPVEKQFELPEANSDMRRVFAYLTKQRFISPEVISHFAHEHKIYEEKKYHNVVFVGTVENGTPKQASLRSSISFGKTFRITVANSDTQYSFSHFGNDEKLFVFEAPIDMLSFISLYPRDWQQHSYIAMNGVYESAILKALENHSELRQIYLCTDNDEGGIDAAERLRDILVERGYTEIFRLAPQQKDWNEQLKQRYGAEFLPAAPHKRKNLYLKSVVELSGMRINPNRIAADLTAIYNSADHIRLAEFSLSASEHFLKIAGSDLDFEKLRNCLSSGYKAYLDKSTIIVKGGNLKNAMNTAVDKLQKSAQTVEGMKQTARLLYKVSDCALRVATEETLMHNAEQKESSEESPSDKPQAFQVISFS